MFSDYPSGFSSRPPPPSPPPEGELPSVDELLSSVTSSKTMLFGPPLVVAMLSFAFFAFCRGSYFGFARYAFGS